MNKKAWFGIVFLVLLIAFLIFIAFVGYGLLYAFHEGFETITISEKWVKYSGDDANYLVSSEDGQVFQITDTLIKLRFNSSNLYAYIKAGQICDIKTQGWRFPLFSDYKNIITAYCHG